MGTDDISPPSDRLTEHRWLGARPLPITPFLSKQASSPEAVQVMSCAFTHACERLGLADRKDQVAELVAEKVIELARCGVSDPDELLKRTLEAFNVRD